MNIISVIMILYSSIPNIIRTVFAIPNVTLMNVMACRVFRNTMLFENEIETEISTIQIY